MINRIIDFSANNKLIVFLLVAAAAVMGWWSMKNVPLDAIPDLSETQVIIYSRWDRSPDILEDQVTYPIVTAMLGAPGVRTVRGFSDFGYSFVYVIFDGGDRHLLGPFADPGVPVGGSAAASPGGPDGAGTRCHGPGLGVPVRARRYDRAAEPGRAPLLPGLVPALLPQVGAGGGRSGARRRFPPAVPGQSRPQPAAVLQHPRQPGGGSDPGEQ